jgi:hypothetical protein
MEPVMKNPLQFEYRRDLASGMDPRRAVAKSKILSAQAEQQILRRAELGILTPVQSENARRAIAAHYLDLVADSPEEYRRSVASGSLDALREFAAGFDDEGGSALAIERQNVEILGEVFKEIGALAVERGSITPAQYDDALTEWLGDEAPAQQAEAEPEPVETVSDDRIDTEAFIARRNTEEVASREQARADNERRGDWRAGRDAQGERVT